MVKKTAGVTLVSSGSSKFLGHKLVLRFHADPVFDHTGILMPALYIPLVAMLSASTGGSIRQPGNERSSASGPGGE